MEKTMTRRGFLGTAAAALATPALMALAAPGQKPPNILLAIADDWSWPHASCLGTRGVSTPAFDRIAQNGVLFTNAFVAAPQCSPCRAAMLTGRNIGQLAEAGTHYSLFPNTWPVFPDLLAAAGYHTGFTGKGWSPGRWDLGGWTRNPAGPEYNARTLGTPPAMGISPVDYTANFKDFLATRPAGAPFCFWFGGHEPHRVYELGSGLRKGLKPDLVPVPGFLPDTPEVRSDFLDYFLEIQWFDTQLSRMLKLLHQAGELDNTLVLVTSDNGMPFPRAKANLYDAGTRVPLAAYWPAGGVLGGRTQDMPVSLIDVAPTLLAAAGLDIPGSMTGLSLMPALLGNSAPSREFIITGRERHGHARFDNLGYPSRALRTKEFLYIRNFEPGRSPAGDPPKYGDIDGSPTKDFMIENRNSISDLFSLSFDIRPEEELYAIQNDSDCLNNLAGKPKYELMKKEMAQKLEKALIAQADPRGSGQGQAFDSYPRFGPMHPELGGFSEQGQYNPAYQ